MKHTQHLKVDSDELRKTILDKLWDDGLDGYLTVVFEKKDGTLREMKCTLVNKYIPEDKKPKGDSSTVNNADVQRVFDVDKMDWRSFRFDSVRQIKYSTYDFVVSK